MKKDQLTDNQFLLKAVTKMNRELMTPRQRKSTRTKQTKLQFQFPRVIERQYSRYIIELMDVYSDITLPTLKNNLPRWTAEQKLDTRTDDFNSDMEQLNNELEQAHNNMFNENGNGVRTERNFFNKQTIMATIIGYGVATSNRNRTQYTRFTKQISGSPFIPREPNLNSLIESWATNNYQLIKSLSTEYIKNVNNIVLSGVYDGRTWDAIMKDISKMDKNITRNRAKLIARDQVGKLNGVLTKKRMVESGFNLYRWSTVRDERVRKPSHTAMEGKICTWSDNTVYADTVQDAIDGKWKKRSSISGFVGIPGQDIQCRCSAIPVSTDFIEEVDKEIEEEI
jgi:SPP1 gp7 family putative phage head morphogenesis protein